MLAFQAHRFIDHDSDQHSSKGLKDVIASLS